MTAELRAFANRLADEIEAARPLEHMKSHPIVRALRKIADEPSCQCHPSFGFHDASCPTLNQDPELIRVNREWAKLHDQQMDDARKWEGLATKAQSDLILSERDVAHWQRNYEEMRQRVVDAEAEVEKVRADLDLEKKCHAANKHAVVLTVGGTVDGAPTNETNYLQRLCELVKTENGYLSDQLSNHASQPTDEERQRLADMARYYGGQGASSLVYVRADDMRRIATLLEQPAPARKSIGRRWVLTHDADVCSAIYTDELQALRDGIGFWVPVLCDLVPVSGEKP